MILGDRGGGFSKNYFFLVRIKLIFDLSQALKKSQFWPNNLRHRQNFKNLGQKKAFLGTFWIILTKSKNRVFFRARSHSKLVYIGAKGAFRKFLRSVTKNGYFKIVKRGKRGTFWVSRGWNP